MLSDQAFLILTAVFVSAQYQNLEHEGVRTKLTPGML